MKINKRAIKLAERAYSAWQAWQRKRFASYYTLGRIRVRREWRLA